MSDLSPIRVDELWVDYADIYLTFGKRIAPNESYWLTDDHIERQAPAWSEVARRFASKLEERRP